MQKNNFFKKIIFLLVTFIFLTGSFSFVLAKKKVAKSVVPKKNSGWNFEEYEVVVKISCLSCLNAMAEKYRVSFFPLGSEENENFYLARSLSRKSAKKLVKILEKDHCIELVQPNFRYKPLGRVSKDAYYSKQWWLFDPAVNVGGTNAVSAWDLETKSQHDVVVAVIDSGVNYKHKDLKKNLTKGSAKGKNFENPKRKPTDSDGHGSFLAGIIAAQTNNKRGIAGASFYNNLKIMPLRFDFTTSQAIEALNYAKAKNVLVANASWGNYGEEGFDLALKDAIFQYPGVFVAASGNKGLNHDSGNADEKMYPCDFDLANIICVSATDQNGNLADYSDFGAASVDIAAPGGSNDFPLLGLGDSKSRYSEAEGSSLSAAFVSAEAGLIFSKYPNLFAAQVIEIIKNSAETNATLFGKVSSGGKVNFLKAMQFAAGY